MNRTFKWDIFVQIIKYFKNGRPSELLNKIYLQSSMAKIKLSKEPQLGEGTVLSKTLFLSL